MGKRSTGRWDSRLSSREQGLADLILLGELLWRSSPPKIGPGLLKELAQRGWTLQELKKISDENFLRVFEEVKHKAAALKQVKTK